MSEENIKQVVAEVVAALRCEMAHTIDDTHREHHEFIAEWIEERKRSRDRWDKIRTQVGGWAIVSMLGGIGTAVYQGFEYLREHLR